MMKNESVERTVNFFFIKFFIRGEQISSAKMMDFQFKLL